MRYCDYDFRKARPVLTKLPNMAKTGRKPWVPTDLERVEKLAARGLTFDQIAAALGISRDTLYRRKRELRDFSDALEKGRARGISEVANKLFETAMQGNITAIIFFLKCRANWRDQGPVVEIHNEQNVNVEQIDPERTRRRMKLLGDMVEVMRALKVPAAEMLERELKKPHGADGE